MTHCDKKPRGKVGGSVISVYLALLHPPTESLGTRLYYLWLVQIIELVPAHSFGTLEISPQASYYLPGSPNSIILFQSRGA